jgi:hypothetical protein
MFRGSPLDAQNELAHLGKPGELKLFGDFDRSHLIILDYQM